MKKGTLYVLACYILWGILPVFWKTLSAVDSMYVLAARIFWSLIFVTVILLLGKNLIPVKSVFRSGRELIRLALSGIFICINWGVYIWAVNNDHMLDASLAYYMNPILSILLGTLVFRERLSKLQWLSVAVTLTGLVIAVIRYGQFPWIALVIGGSFAIYGAIKKGVTASAGVSVFFETMFLSPFALIFMLWMDTGGSGAIGVLQNAQWLLLPAAGIVTTIPLLCFAEGIKTTPMSLSGLLMYINPTLQLLLSVLVYGEEFTTTHAILFGFVWIGVALYLLAGFRKKHQ